MRLIPVFLCLLFAASASAQTLYRYQDEQGQWQFTDRPPEDEKAKAKVSTERLSPKHVAATVELERVQTENGVSIVATNHFHCPVQLVFELGKTRNVPSKFLKRHDVVLRPDSRASVLEIPMERGTGTSFEIAFSYLPGDPTAEHDDSTPYRLPYAISTSQLVTQAFPTRITHTTPSSEHAMDFAMPEGTPIYAARAGVVFDIAYGSFSGGVSVADLPKANFVRIAHDDGTMAVYAHLSWNAIRVRPGKRVRRGEYIADSGNTGFSSGPHLHFAVQRNNGREIVSVPIAFAGAGGKVVTPATGATLTAY
ncbi:MAG: peptidoglycan DD-metalloendopeptidase family protein [Gammaproteobacteria bacterium]